MAGYFNGLRLKMNSAAFIFASLSLALYFAALVKILIVKEIGGGCLLILAARK